MGISCDEIEERVLNGLRDHLVSSDAIAEAVRAFHEETNRLNRERRSQVEIDKKALVKVIQGIKIIIASIEEGMFHLSMKARMDELEMRRAELEGNISAAPAEDLPDVIPNIAEIYRTKVKCLSEALSVQGTSQTASELIRSLIGQVVLQPNGGGSYLVIDLHRELAAVLYLAKGRNDPVEPRTCVSDNALSCRLALVAGARCKHNCANIKQSVSPIVDVGVWKFAVGRRATPAIGLHPGSRQHQNILFRVGLNF